MNAGIDSSPASLDVRSRRAPKLSTRRPDACTRLGTEGVTDAEYRQAREHFSDQALVELTFRVIAINDWNRLNIALRAAPGGLDRRYSLDKAGLV